MLAGEIAKVLEPVAKPFDFSASAHPHVILLVAVHGTGHTHTASQLGQPLTPPGLPARPAAS